MWEFAESKSSGGGQADYGSAYTPSAASDGFMNIGDVDGEELPFN